LFRRCGLTGVRERRRRPTASGQRGSIAPQQRLAQDDGFTLMETVVSMALLAIVMTAATSFFVNVLQSSGYLRGKQAAVQYADDTMEQARAFEIKSLVSGRDQTTSDSQWNAGNANALVATYLSGTQEVYDPAVTSGAGASCSVISTPTAPACLPTVPVTSTFNGIVYSANTYLGSCVKLSGNTTCTKATLSSISNPANVGFYRVIVAVTWPSKSCAGQLCTYVTAELMNVSTDPVFNINTGSNVATGEENAPLALTSPGNQSTTAGVPVNLQLLYSDGTGQVTWSASSMPLGLSVDATTGVVYGTPSCLINPCKVTISGKDSIDPTSTITFYWTVNKVPQVTTPNDGGTMTSSNGVAIPTVTLAASDGSPAYTWSATGLPPGLSLTSSNTITGTPTTNGTYTTTVKVVDTSGKSDTAVVTWVIVSAIVDPGAKTVPANTAVSLQLVQHGENSPVVWSATGLPTGLTINASTGLISGTPTLIQSTTSTIKVTDGSGTPPSITIAWTVTGRIGQIGDLSGACIDVSGNVSTDNTPMLAYTCQTGANQVFSNLADGTLRVTSGGAVRCLTATSFANAALLISRPCGNSYQTWSLKPVTGGNYQLQMTQLLTTYCAGLGGSAKNNGQQLSLVSCTGSSAANRTYWDMGA
jgi:prepilin-type N-terminal cleavage/methylation domain-containing protein